MIENIQDVKELFFIGFKNGLLISGITGIVSIGIKYSLKLLQKL